MTPTPSAEPRDHPADAAKAVRRVPTATDDLLPGRGGLLAIQLNPRDAEARLTSAAFLSSGNRLTSLTWGARR